MATNDDFDPARVLDGWRAPAPAPIDLDIGRLLDSGHAALDEAKKARLKARGYTLHDVEDVELPAVKPRPPVNDIPQVHLPAARKPQDPRMLTAWQPRAWTALARRVRGASSEIRQTPHGPQVDNLPPQWLCAVWPPQRVDVPLLGRWPELVTLISAETAFGALHQLLPQLPPDALLWPAALDTDWGLLAELMLHQDSRLRPAQQQSLRELIDAERSASFARMNDGYAFQGRAARRKA